MEGYYEQNLQGKTDKFGAVTRRNIMGIFEWLKGTNINEGLQEFAQTPGALLLDVRTPQEYREGRIPGSRNVPLDSIDRLTLAGIATDTPIFVYCHSGGRSRQAAALLQQMGKKRVKNIGGIIHYQGKVER